MFLELDHLVIWQPDGPSVNGSKQPSWLVVSGYPRVAGFELRMLNGQARAASAAHALGIKNRAGGVS